MQFINYSVYSYSATAGSPDSTEVRRRASDAIFGQRLILNNYRAVIAEAMIASELEPEWRWCSADWAGWDFDRSDGVRLEVKQSAGLQTWHRPDSRPSACSFDIRSRKGRYEAGVDWKPDEGRNADLYVFAHHHVVTAEADHADPSQWHFYIVLARDLPPTKTIGLRRINALAEPKVYSDLKPEVEAAADRVRQEQGAFRKPGS